MEERTRNKKIKKQRHAIQALGLKILNSHTQLSQTRFSLFQKTLTTMLSHSNIYGKTKKGQIIFLLKLSLKSASSKGLSKFMTPGCKLQEISTLIFFIRNLAKQKCSELFFLSSQATPDKSSL